MVSRRSLSLPNGRVLFRPLAAFALAAFLLASGLSGCQQLFTTTLAASLARSSLPIPSNLTPAQAEALAKKAKDNPKLAETLVTSLVSQIASTTDPATKAALEATAASTAVVASGASAAITSLVSTYANGTTPDAGTLYALLATIQDGTSGADVTALKYLDPTNLTSAEVTAAGLGPTDLAVAAVVLAASAIPAGTNLSDSSSIDTTALTTAITATGAPSIMEEAVAMLPSDSQSSGLLNTISQYFIPATTPST